MDMSLCARREEAEADEQFWGQTALIESEDDLDYDSTDSACFLKTLILSLCDCPALIYLNI